MSLFSQRNGMRPLQKQIQIESIDEELKNSLWSALKLSIWDKSTVKDSRGYEQGESNQFKILYMGIWLNYFKLPIDDQPNFIHEYPKSGYDIIREYFFGAEWWEIFDFIEFIIKQSHENWKEKAAKSINYFLEVENSAYRIVGEEVVQITDEIEIDEIETALSKHTELIKSHIQKALGFLSDKTNPDYQNSMKESISAVEVACQMISGKKSTTLGDCLKVIKQSSPLHPAFEKALLQLYGYTSDEGGVRHANKENSNPPSYADAKFMLVTCTTFVNYLMTKAAENNITVNE